VSWEDRGNSQLDIPKCEVMKHCWIGIGHSHDHVEGRGLARRASTHCVDFSEREKGQRHECVKVLSVTYRDRLIVTAEND
jgi:hypothetical protein